MPDAFAELKRIHAALEKHYRDMQDLEFTVEQGKLCMLQTRNGKRTAKAALRIAVDMAQREADQQEGGGDAHRAGVARPAPASDASIRAAERKVIANGPAGVARRRLRRDRVLRRRGRECASARDTKCILVRIETSPDDIHGMHAAEGILTTRGGMTSHAAVVARGMGKPCVSGCRKRCAIDYRAQTMTVGGTTLQEGRLHHASTARPARCSPARCRLVQPALAGEFADADAMGR